MEVSNQVSWKVIVRKGRAVDLLKATAKRRRTKREIMLEKTRLISETRDREALMEQLRRLSLENS